MPVPAVTPTRCELPGAGELFAQYWRAPQEARAAIGLVHGLGEHSGRYAWVAERLTEAGFDVVTFDQRGHGRSGGRRGDAPSYHKLLDDLECLCQALHALPHHRPALLYGHSLGGNLVLNLALNRRPQLRGLILSSPLFLPARPVPRWKTLAGRILARTQPGFGFHTGIQAEQLSHDAAANAAYRADPLVHSRVSARIAVAMLDAGRTALERAAELTYPTLLMHGSADQVTACRASQQFADRAGPQCSFHLWPDLFHELHWETAREAVVRSVLEWLDRQL